MKSRSQLAVVDNVESEDYTGDVTLLWQFTSINTATQMNKAVPILLEMRDDIKEMKGDLKAVKANTDTIPQVLDEIKGLTEEIPDFH